MMIVDLDCEGGCGGSGGGGGGNMSGSMLFKIYFPCCEKRANKRQAWLTTFTDRYIYSVLYRISFFFLSGHVYMFQCCVTININGGHNKFTDHEWLCFCFKVRIPFIYAHVDDDDDDDFDML